MKGKKVLIVSLFLSLVMILSSCGKKAPYTKDLKTLKNQETFSKSSLVFSVLVDERSSEKGNLYIVDIKTKEQPLSALKFIIIAKEDKDFLLTYNYYNKQDTILVKNKTKANEVESIRMLATSLVKITTFYCYLEYDSSSEFLEVSVGDYNG